MPKFDLEKLSSTHCPHCRARQRLISLKIPDGDEWRCRKCGQRFALNEDSVAILWASVFWIWSFGFQFLTFSLSFLKNADGFLNKVVGVFIFSPLASAVLASVIAFVGWNLAKKSMGRLRASGRASTLKRELKSEHVPGLEPSEDTVDHGPSREYRHAACGAVTAISGDEFERLANPFALVGGTFCAGCDRDISLSDVCWTDTEEPISDYRARLRDKAPKNIRLIGTLGVPAGGFLMGAILGSAISGNTFWIIADGTLFGFVAAAFLAPMVTRRLGVDYRNVK